MFVEGMSTLGILNLESITEQAYCILKYGKTSPHRLSRSFPVSGPQEVSTRVMIFSSFRESVQEIAAMLNRHAPLIRVMTFMGQASAGKGVKGFTQKEQLEVETVCFFFLIKGRITVRFK